MTSRPDPEIIHEGRFIRFQKVGDWEFIQRNNCTGIVIIVPMTDDQQVIFVEQYRPPVDKFVIEFPAGLLNDRADYPDESIESGAKRELMEETGYRAEQIIPLLDGPISAGSSADTVTMVRAAGLTKVGTGGGDETESIRIHEVKLSDVDAWLEHQRQQGFMIEPKIYSGLYFLKSYNSSLPNKVNL